MKKSSRQYLHVFLIFICFHYSPIVTAQSAETTTSYDAELAEMLSSMALSEGHSVTIEGPIDADLRIELQQSILENLKNQNPAGLSELFTKHALVVNYRKTSETTLVLRSLGSAEQRLLISVQNNNINKVKKILEQETIDLNKRVEINGMLHGTPITTAAFYQNIPMVKLLLDHGANPNTDIESRLLPALAHAVKSHNIDLTKLLLEAGASVDFDYKNVGGDPLALWAAQISDLSLMKLLINAGMDPSQIGNHGWTPLSEALRLGHSAMAEFLIDSNDPRVLTTDEGTYSMHNRFDGRYFPQSNALHLARHFLDTADRERLVNKILERTELIGEKRDVAMLQLQSYNAASTLAYEEFRLKDALEERRKALPVVDTIEFDSSADKYLRWEITAMLANMHELAVVAGETLTPDDYARIDHIISIDNTFAKWHDMLEIMRHARHADATAEIEQWRARHGNLKQKGWNYDMLFSWADEIENREDRTRVYNTLNLFRPSIFK